MDSQLLTSRQRKPLVATADLLPVVMRLRCLLCGLKGFSFLADSSLYSRFLQTGFSPGINKVSNSKPCLIK